MLFTIVFLSTRSDIWIEVKYLIVLLGLKASGKKWGLNCGLEEHYV